MDTLRVSLIIVGILIIGAIYLLGRRKIDADEQPASDASFSWLGWFSRFKTSLPKWEESVNDEISKHEELSAEDLAAVKTIVAERKQVISTAEDVTLIVELTSEQIAPAGEQLFVPITIIARNGRTFSGEDIQTTSSKCGFYLDETGVFYLDSHDSQGFKQKLLGLANIVEPGTFDGGKLDEIETPGLVLYLHLPAPIEAREAFTTLIDKGKEISVLLSGDVCDETRSVLTNQMISHLKEKVEAYRFKQKMTQLKNNRK